MMYMVVFALSLQAASPTPMPAPAAVLPPQTFWLKQLTLRFPARIDDVARKAAIQRFGAAMQSIDGCAAADSVAAQQGVEIVENKSVSSNAMPPSILAQIAATPLGHAIQMFGDQSGMRVLVICGRGSK